jgi:sec-independent protein translocase protein TatB
MPSFQDSAILLFLALLLFGPKKLPELARQLGKLMAEFRRASNEFRMQMDEELRLADQEEQRKKIAAMEAAAPVTPAISDGTENTIAPPATEEFLVGHPHEQPQSDPSPDESSDRSFAAPSDSSFPPPPDRYRESTADEAAPKPLPIATSGDLNLMPPSTGLPISNSALSPMLDSIPHDPEPAMTAAEVATSEVPQRG